MESLGVDDARFPRPISRGCRGARDMTALVMHFMFYALCFMHFMHVLRTF